MVSVNKWEVTVTLFDFASILLKGENLFEDDIYMNLKT